MLGMLLLLLLLILLFGGLGLFVAKIFFVVLIVALLLSLLGGGGTIAAAAPACRQLSGSQADILHAEAAADGVMAIGPGWTATERPAWELRELRNLRPVIHGRRAIVFYDRDAPARNAACCIRIDGHYLWLNDLRTTVPLRTRIRSVRGSRHHVRFLQTGRNVELVLDEGGRGWLRQPG